MLSRKHKQEVVVPMAPPLADRIAELHGDIEALIESRINEINAGGVPREVIKQMIVGGSGCPCRAATKILADRARDEEIAARQS
jgi:hypothetical protein